MSVPGITQTSQYLTFVLDQEIYAMDINQVREVLDFTKITKVPRMPDFIKGVINLRGGVVPVVDLRLKFGLSQAEKTVDTCIIIIEITVQETRTLLGIMADSVQEVMGMGPDQIEPAPKIGTRLKTEFIKGMGKKNEDFIIILDSDEVFSADELVVFQANDDSPEINEEASLNGNVNGVHEISA
ncbi:chemotaxis protein CheW [Desulfospira joergensenii]|uniref:chemotaxis protein CheW n=1 Tax=Desulfospira joergensenii TaxID=53329 RepID=UPI0003B48A28|nr:chemotaxis protein CheW [Desulfospira joergensenii]